MEQLSPTRAPLVRVADFMLTATIARTPQDRRSMRPFLSANDGLFLSLGLSSFYSELMKGLGAGGRLWELLERQPQMPLNGGSEVGLLSAGVLKSKIWTVRAVFCPPQRVGHCYEVTSASEQGEERWGFLRDTGGHTSGKDLEMWGSEDMASAASR